MRSIQNKPAFGGLFSGIGSSYPPDRLDAIRENPATPNRLPIHHKKPQAQDTRMFEGQMLQELAGAFRRRNIAQDPEAVVSSIVGLPAAHRFESFSRSNGCLPAGLTGPNMLAAPKLVKRAFDFYFREDLYGDFANLNPIILSSGSYDESVFGLPNSLKECIRYALDMNWYGYSDSLGRKSTREALAQLETLRTRGRINYQSENIAVTLGGTATLGSLVDLIVERFRPGAHAVACIPNYPPLVASMARHLPTHLVPTPLVDGRVDMGPLLEALEEKPAIVLLQVVVNPWGLRVSEADIDQVILALPDDCFLLLDECHDTAGPPVSLTPNRLHERVISFRSMSKRWAAPGLKVGWLVGGQDFIRDFYEHASTTYGGPASLLYLFLEMFALFETAHLAGTELADHRAYLNSEYGLTSQRLAAALEDYCSSAQQLTALVRSRREYSTTRLRAAGIPVLEPDYSINLTVRLGETPSYPLYRQLVREAGVSVFPGLLTMGDGRGVVRLSPCLDEGVLEDALDRLTAWHDKQN